MHDGYETNTQTDPRNIRVHLILEQKLQVHAIAIDIYKAIMDLATNGVVIMDAIKCVNGKLDPPKQTREGDIAGYQGRY